MYGLSVEEKDLYLTKAMGDDVVITLAKFVVPFGSSKSDVVQLAEEMVGVLNRHLPLRERYPEVPWKGTSGTEQRNVFISTNENRENDIAHSSDKEWPIDPATGTPKLEPVGEIKDFPEPGVAHPVGCNCLECASD